MEGRHCWSEIRKPKPKPKTDRFAGRLGAISPRLRRRRSLGLPVVCVGIRGEASAELMPLVRRFYWTRPTQMGRMIRSFKREGVEQIVMAGKVHKANLLHRPWKLFTLLPDWRTLSWWYLSQAGRQPG